jgi:DNA-binding transcriptional MerR regulator
MSSGWARTPEDEGHEAGTWMLQADAAAAAGCSVSVIRKWRRAGAVAERTRTSSGGMKRIEVRLADVLAKMEDSMPGRASQNFHPPQPVATPPIRETPVLAERPLPPADLEVFVRHIAEAERRAANAEAQLQANEAMTGLLRERIATLQAQLESLDAMPVGDEAPLSLGLHRLVGELREFRKRFEEIERNGVRHDVQQRVTARVTYDAALISLCVAAGISTRFKLGASLTPKDRTRLAKALAESGLDVAP